MIKKQLLLVILVQLSSANLFRGGVKINGVEEKIHTELQEDTKQEAKLSLIDEQIRKMEKEIEKKKLEAGDKELENLQKEIDQVKVYRLKPEEKQSKDEIRDQNTTLYYLRNPNLALKAQAQVNEQAKNLRNPGKSLSEVVKQKGNPFQGLFEIQAIIDSAEVQIKKNKNKEEEKEQELIIPTKTQANLLII